MLGIYDAVMKFSFLLIVTQNICIRYFHQEKANFFFEIFFLNIFFTNRIISTKKKKKKIGKKKKKKEIKKKE